MAKRSLEVRGFQFQEMKWLNYEKLSPGKIPLTIFLRSCVNVFVHDVWRVAFGKKESVEGSVSSRSVC